MPGPKANKAKAARGKGYKPARFETVLVSDETDARILASAIELALFHARTVDEAIARKDWTCLADCIAQNKKLVPHAKLRGFLVRVLRGEKRPVGSQRATEAARVRRFDLAHMARMLEADASTKDAFEETARLYGVPNFRTIQKARAEHPPVITQAEFRAALDELKLAVKAGLIEGPRDGASK
jgi:uncharacterized alpha-E superfamily protein